MSTISGVKNIPACFSPIGSLVLHLSTAGDVVLAATPERQNSPEFSEAVRLFFRQLPIEQHSFSEMRPLSSRSDHWADPKH
nr:hypothetical protein [uncultured Cohaesibacter sp.]